MQVDASKVGLGVVLVQANGGEEHSVPYLSLKMLPRKENYATVKKECLAIKWALETLAAGEAVHVSHAWQCGCPSRRDGGYKRSREVGAGEEKAGESKAEDCENSKKKKTFGRLDLNLWYREPFVNILVVVVVFFLRDHFELPILNTVLDSGILFFVFVTLVHKTPPHIFLPLVTLQIIRFIGTFEFPKEHLAIQLQILKVYNLCNQVKLNK